MEKARCNLSAVQKTGFVILGALLMGFMWHVRGQHGFGAKWGMFAVGFVIALFIYAFYGKRQKMNYELMPLAAAFAAITAGGWGTLNAQISGVLKSSELFTGEAVERVTEISTYSGWAIMLLLGFGWMPLFSIVIGSFFSKKKYEFKDYVIFVGVYYVTVLICNFTLSHYIFEVINPQAVECCAEGLIDAGHDTSPWKAFVTNFGSAAWAKRIPYCRNYFQSIKVISSAVGALVSSVAVGVVLKDKFNAVFSSLSNFSCAIGISVASLFRAISTEERFVFKNIELPQYVAINSWELWEYFTGFIYGLLICLVIVLLPRKFTDSEEDFEYCSMIKNDRFRIFYNEVFTVLFSFGVVLSRAIGLRAPRAFIEDDTVEIIVTVILSVLCYFLFVRKLITKNMREKALSTPFEESPQNLAQRTLPIYIIVCALCYFFMGGKTNQNILAIDYGTLFTEGGLQSLWSSGALTDIALMLPTFILIMVLLKLLKSKKSDA